MQTAEFWTRIRIAVSVIYDDNPYINDASWNKSIYKQRIYNIFSGFNSVYGTNETEKLIWSWKI